MSRRIYKTELAARHRITLGLRQRQQAINGVGVLQLPNRVYLWDFSEQEEIESEMLHFRANRTEYTFFGKIVIPAWQREYRNGLIAMHRYNVSVRGVQERYGDYHYVRPERRPVIG